MKARITRQYLFRGLHSLENPKLSESENRDLYGICFRQHGHHYKLQVTVEGDIHSETGLSVDRDDMDFVVQSRLIERLDGQDLNLIYPNTAGEALVQEFYQALHGHFKEARLVRVGIQETRKNWFEFPG